MVRYCAEAACIALWSLRALEIIVGNCVDDPNEKARMHNVVQYTLIALHPARTRVRMSHSIRDLKAQRMLVATDNCSMDMMTEYTSKYEMWRSVSPLESPTSNPLTTLCAPNFSSALYQSPTPPVATIGFAPLCDIAVRKYAPIL